jgi:Fur family ferric uptake transcriptional regulator
MEAISMDSTELKKAGLKATLPRLRILSILEQRADEHLSAEDVYKALIDADEDVGLATVYRVLTQFESAGLVIRRNFEGGRSVFELDSGQHHDHLVCLGCGCVVEFVDETIEKRQQDIAKRHDFRIMEHSLVIYGHCTNCGSAGS